MRLFALLSVTASACIIACTSFSGTDQTAPSNDGGSTTAEGGPTNGSPDGSSACALGTCESRDPSCSYFDFAGPACPPEFSTSGDTLPRSGLVFDCTDGTLHLAASATLDITAKVRPKTPPTATAVHVQARLAISSWVPEGDAFKVQAGGVFSLRARTAPTGRLEVNACVDGMCTSTPLQTGVGESHLYGIDISGTAITVSVDCQPRWEHAPTKLDFGSDLTISFGEPDGNPFDARLDDMEVSFR